MSIKSLATLTTVVAALFSQMSLAVLPPLSQQAREESSSAIVTGYVISIKKEIKPVNHGTNAYYTVRMIVNNVEKGKGLQTGQSLTFGYWKQDTRPQGWCGDSGQYKTIKHHTTIKAYLHFDEGSGEFSLLHPNGFDEVDS